MYRFEGLPINTSDEVQEAGKYLGEGLRILARTE